MSLRHLRRGMLLGIAWFVPVFLVGIGLEMGSEMLAHAVLPEVLRSRLQEVQDAASVSQFLGPMPLGRLVVVLVAGAIIIPIVEELCFRGFVYNAFRMRWGVAWGVAISALIFAAAHFPLLAILPYLFLSVTLAVCYAKTGTLIAPITVHALNNAIGIILAGFGIQEP